MSGNKRTKGASLIVTMSAEAAASLIKGDTVYTAELRIDVRSYGDTWTQRLEAALVPYRKNMSGEECERGWCGNTNGLNTQALGRAVVTQIFPERSINYSGPGYDERLVRVRMTPDAEPTFAYVKDAEGDYEMVRLPTATNQRG